MSSTNRAFAKGLFIGVLGMIIVGSLWAADHRMQTEVPVKIVPYATPPPNNCKKGYHATQEFDENDAHGTLQRRTVCFQNAADNRKFDTIYVKDQAAMLKWQAKEASDVR